MKEKEYQKQILWKLITWSPRRISTKHKKALENLEKPQTSENSAKSKSPVRERAKIEELIYLTYFCLENINPWGNLNHSRVKGSQRRNALLDTNWLQKIKMENISVAACAHYSKGKKKYVMHKYIQHWLLLEAECQPQRANRLIPHDNPIFLCI